MSYEGRRVYRSTTAETLGIYDVAELGASKL
jgi:hypothetical protein